MNNTSTLLRERALHSYQQVLAEKSRDVHLYRQLTLRDALQLKLWRLFGGKCLIDVEEAENESVLGAVIEGLNFIGIRRSDGDVHLVLVEPCPRCGARMTSHPLTSLIALGRELFQLEIASTLSNHVCSGQIVSPAFEDTSLL